jgi:ribonuclease P protein subunit RPR2
VKPILKQIALERMTLLIQSAISNARSEPELAQRQAMLAKKISSRHKVRMPFELRMNFCKKCKSFIAPGIGSKIRIGRSKLKSIRITCMFCGHTYRKIIAQ